MGIPWESELYMQKAIYKITNQVNGKSYIGQSVNPYHRFVSHKSRARNHDFRSSQALYHAILKYGEENFKMEILEWTEDYNEKERYYIHFYGTLSPNGYNIAPGGEDPPHKYGIEHHNSAVTEEQVDIIIAELKRGVLTEPSIGSLFNPPISQVLVNNINFGITHHRQNEIYPIRTQCPYNLSQKQLDDIIWLLLNTTCTMKQIADYFRFNVSTIKAINTGRNHFNPKLYYPLRTFRGCASSQPVETILANRSTSVIDTQMEMGICN
jgi:group I intron endonuclease